MSEIYTRDYGRTRRRESGYTPPPGYDGTLFSDEGMKMHEADVDISTLSRDKNVNAEAEDEITPAELCLCEEVPSVGLSPIEEDSVRRDRGRIEDLIRSLRGRFGTEEIILILILLIVSSDGIGIEALVLGLLLMVKQ